MRIDNEFVVKAPIGHVWSYMLDVEKVAPCVPGAELTEVVDDHTWKGKTNIKVGPVALSFTGTVVLEERDDANHRVVLKAQGMEQRGKGAASATAVSRLENLEDATRVVLETDLIISGAVAQYGRGMISDISTRLTKEFAGCLESNILATLGTERAAAEAIGGPTPGGEVAAGGAGLPAEAGGPGPTAVARPVRGFRLGLWAFWRAIVRFFKRLFGRGSD
jgi:carbon monoxide dehydrogenase subunit G